MKCSVYIATSTDGFIATPDGGIDWLIRPEYEDAGNIGLVYNDFISTVDAIVMGRLTFEKALTFDKWYYEGTDVVVLTSKDLTLPDHLSGKVRFKSGSPEEIIRELTLEGKKHLYIDGGLTIQKFLNAKLIDEITITEIPILLGSGIPLFGNSGSEHPLEVIGFFASDKGPIQKRYRVKPAR